MKPIIIDARRLGALIDRVHRDLTDGDPFEEKMPRLVAERHAQFAWSAILQAAIRANLSQHIVHDYAPLLGGMADKIQSLEWD